MAKITFLGAAGTVTGSKYLIETGSKRLLVDCGLFQGSKDLQQRNWNPLTVDPGTIDWVLLTHAHIDHTGYLPAPGSRRISRPNICGRRDARTMQSAAAGFGALAGRRCAICGTQRIQQPQTAAAALHRGASAGSPRRVSRKFRARAISRSAREFSVRTHDAGHILGSTVARTDHHGEWQENLIVFSGDIGRYDQPILNDPEPPSRADFLLCESTYGDRDHGTGSVPDELADVINRVAKRGGMVVIPSFAVGRTQTLMYYLRQLDDAKRIPKLPVYVDSPMAISVTDIYARHHEDHDLDFTKLEQQGDRDPLNLQEVHMTRTRGRFQENQRRGFTLHHCFGERHGHRRARAASSGETAAGFAQRGAAGGLLSGGYARTRAARRRAVSCASTDKKCQCALKSWCSINFPRTRARSELLRWLSGFSAPPRQTFLVHGEPSGLEGTARRNRQPLSLAGDRARLLAKLRFEYVGTVAPPRISRAGSRISSSYSWRASRCYTRLKLAGGAS